jgi:GT2 family glycosyltransferase
MLKSLKVAVGIATAGRREVLSETLRELSKQTRQPECVFVCPASDIDFDSEAAAALPYPLIVVRGARGLCAQRNAIIDKACSFDLLVFFDDDFFAAPTYLQEAEKCFVARPEVTCATGYVIADGIKGPGLDFTTARAAIADHRPRFDTDFLEDRYNAYGCNMALRLAPIYAHGLRFDENLPLYGWLEDVDFCRGLARYGRIVRNEKMAGVHLGSKAGRTPGVRMGYSQIANPVYLYRKGHFRADLALGQMGRNILANLGNLALPEPWVDRRGRTLGNLIAILDLFRGRLDPRRSLDFV